MRSLLTVDWVLGCRWCTESVLRVYSSYPRFGAAPVRKKWKFKYVKSDHVSVSMVFCAHPMQWRERRFVQCESGQCAMCIPLHYILLWFCRQLLLLMVCFCKFSHTGLCQIWTMIRDRQKVTIHQITRMDQRQSPHWRRPHSKEN